MRLRRFGGETVGSCAKHGFKIRSIPAFFLTVFSLQPIHLSSCEATISDFIFKHKLILLQDMVSFSIILGAVTWKHHKNERREANVRFQ